MCLVGLSLDTPVLSLLSAVGEVEPVQLAVVDARRRRRMHQVGYRGLCLCVRAWCAPTSVSATFSSLVEKMWKVRIIISRSQGALTDPTARKVRILPSNARCRHPGTEKSLCWSAIVLALTPCSMFESPNWCLWPVMRACQRVCPAVRRSIASAMVPAAPTEKGIPSQQIIRLCLQLLFRRILLRVTDNHLQLRPAHSRLPLASASSGR